MKLSRFIRKKAAPDSQLSYSQFGEDLIIAFLFNYIDIKHPTYLDIGANEPRFISNTYYFYQRGSRGVLVEPNPHLYKKLKKYRPQDTVLNCGIGIADDSVEDFYIFPNYANGLSTFSEKEARHWETIGMKGLGKIPVEKVIKMPLVTVNTILEKHFLEKSPNFISLDVEGLDLDILKSLNFDKYRPEVFCVETLGYDENQQNYKMQETIDFMLSKDYKIYADTRVNTIFCKNEIG